MTSPADALFFSRKSPFTKVPDLIPRREKSALPNPKLPSLARYATAGNREDITGTGINGISFLQATKKIDNSKHEYQK
jgi:hypothetical protein